MVYRTFCILSHSEKSHGNMFCKMLHGQLCLFGTKVCIRDPRNKAEDCMRLGFGG